MHKWAKKNGIRSEIKTQRKGRVTFKQRKISAG
jgi:hypothetical protein